MNDSSSNNIESTPQPAAGVDAVDAKRSCASSATRSDIIELRTERARLLRVAQEEIHAARKWRNEKSTALETALTARCSCLSLRRSLPIRVLEDNLRSAEVVVSEAEEEYAKLFDTFAEGRTWSRISPSATNPWKSKLQGSTPRPNGLREQAARHYGCYQLASGNAILAKCIVTGIEGDRKKVTNAHLLPRHALKHFLDELCMPSVDDQKNMIMLCIGIDEAFANEKLCFIRDEQDPSLTCFRLKIWDDRTRAKPLFHGASKTIGDYESKPF